MYKVSAEETETQNNWRRRRRRQPGTNNLGSKIKRERTFRKSTEEEGGIDDVEHGIQIIGSEGKKWRIQLSVSLCTFSLFPIQKKNKRREWLMKHSL